MRSNFKTESYHSQAVRQLKFVENGDERFHAIADLRSAKTLPSHLHEFDLSANSFNDDSSSWNNGHATFEFVSKSASWKGKFSL